MKNISFLLFVISVFVSIETQAQKILQNHIYYEVDTVAQTAEIVGTDTLSIYLDALYTKRVIITYADSTRKLFNIVKIRDEAFKGCTITLKSRRGISNNSLTIGKNAFSGCTFNNDIVNIQVDHIEEEAFSDCIFSDSTTVNLKCYSIGARAFSNTKGIEKCYLQTYSDSLGENTFINSELKSLTISGNIDTIPQEMCYNCLSLREVNIESAINHIGDYAFYRCENLSKVNFVESSNEEPLTIGSCAFYVCESLMNIKIPERVTSIGSWAFKATGWYEAQPNGVLYLGKWLIDYKGSITENTSIVIPDSIVGIAARAFAGKINLYDIRQSGIDTSSVINNCKLRYINEEAFSGCTNLTKAYLQPYVLGKNGFRDCKKLQNINYIAWRLNYIDDYAFAFCESMQDINLNGVNYIGESAFCRCGLKNIYFTGDSIANHAFAENRSLKTVDMNPRVIESSAFIECDSLESIELIDIEHIGDRAFYKCFGLKDITIGNYGYFGLSYSSEKLKYIGNYAFYKCTGVETFIIASTETMTGTQAFQDCTGELFVGFRNIPAEAFYLSDFSSIVFDDGIESIGSEAFKDCRYLKSITLSKSLKTIGYEAFFNNPQLVHITIPENVTMIEDRAFNGYTGLRSITVETSTPPAVYLGTFNTTNQDSVTLYVPTGSKNVYENTEIWKDFYKIEELDITNISKKSYDDLEINVSDGIITINNIDDNETIRIYDISGKLVYEGTDNILSLKKGIYICRIENRVCKINVR